MQTFQTTDELMNYFNKKREISMKNLLASELKPSDCRHGDFLVRTEPFFGGYLTIYTEVIEPGETDIYDSEEEQQEDEDADMQARRAGYVFGKHFSEVLPEGELGTCHVYGAKKITKAEFEAAAKRGWSANSSA